MNIFGCLPSLYFALSSLLRPSTNLTDTDNELELRAIYMLPKNLRSVLASFNFAEIIFWVLLSCASVLFTIKQTIIWSKTVNQ